MLVLVRITQIRGILLTDMIEINCCFSKFDSGHGPLHARASTHFTLSLAISMCLSVILFQSFNVMKSPFDLFILFFNTIDRHTPSLWGGSRDVMLKLLKFWKEFLHIQYLEKCHPIRRQCSSHANVCTCEKHETPLCVILAASQQRKLYGKKDQRGERGCKDCSKVKARPLFSLWCQGWSAAVNHLGESKKPGGSFSTY